MKLKTYSRGSWTQRQNQPTWVLWCWISVKIKIQQNKTKQNKCMELNIKIGPAVKRGSQRNVVVPPIMILAFRNMIQQRHSVGVMQWQTWKESTLLISSYIKLYKRPHRPAGSEKEQSNTNRRWMFSEGEVQRKRTNKVVRALWVHFA